MNKSWTLAPTILAAVVAGTPAGGAVITQSRSVAGFQPYDGFSSSLGTLDGVVLQVTARTNRGWFVDAPAGSPPNVITWSIDSYFTLRSNLPDSSLAGFPLRVESRGGGSLVQNSGTFDISAVGAGAFDLDPSLFIDVGPFEMTIGDPGLSSASESGTTIGSSFPATLFQTLGRCEYGMLSTQCGSGAMALTYNYTPAGAVPEPAGWAMMIMGFGAVGGVMRRGGRRNVGARVRFG